MNKPVTIKPTETTTTTSQISNDKTNGVTQPPASKNEVEEKSKSQIKEPEKEAPKQTTETTSTPPQPIPLQPVAKPIYSPATQIISGQQQLITNPIQYTSHPQPAAPYVQYAPMPTANGQQFSYAPGYYMPPQPQLAPQPAQQPVYYYYCPPPPQPGLQPMPSPHQPLMQYAMPNQQQAFFAPQPIQMPVGQPMMYMMQPPVTQSTTTSQPPTNPS